VVEKAKYGNPEAMHKIGCAYASKDNKKKATLWLGISAALGFYESQISLGDLLKEDNPECALQWYEKAQKNGLVHAGCRIGDKLFKNRRYYEAEEEYIKAAEGGDPYSQNHLGEFYRDGYCLKKRYYVYTAGVDYGMALKWFQKASDQNYAEAHYNIGYMYEMGWGAKEDKYKALYWYEKSNVGGYGGAHATIERLNNEGYIYFPQRKY
jgi:TPR repeat protein